jgi:uncharacterized membrane protein
MKQSSAALVVIILLMTLYTITFCAVSIRRYDTLDTGGYDLGIYDQTAWNTAHGRFLRYTIVEGRTIKLAEHVEPILLPIALLYLIYSSPVTLLILQTAVWRAEQASDNCYGHPQGRTNSNLGQADDVVPVPSVISVDGF